MMNKIPEMKFVRDSKDEIKWLRFESDLQGINLQIDITKFLEKFSIGNGINIYQFISNLPVYSNEVLVLENEDTSIFMRKSISKNTNDVIFQVTFQVKLYHKVFGELLKSSFKFVDTD